MPLSRRGKREGFADDGFHDLAAANALRADPAGHRLPVFFDTDALQIRPKRATGNPGRLAAVAPQVLRFAALGKLIASHRLFLTQFAVHSHENLPSQTRP